MNRWSPMLDLGHDNPITLSAKSMSNACAKELVTSLRLGGFDTSVANDEFLLSCAGKTHFSLPQKQYIYDLGRKFKLI